MMKRLTARRDQRIVSVQSTRAPSHHIAPLLLSHQNNRQMSKTKNGSGFSLKDQLFNRESVEYLGNLFVASDPAFDRGWFVRHGIKPFGQLELKQRIVHLAQILESCLSPDFKIAARQIVAALPPPLDPTNVDNDFGDFIFAPLGEYIVRNGLEKRYLKLSLRTIHAITQRFSMEHSIRAFINTFPDETLAVLGQWVTHKNYHVRRLVSEGTRPLLPWSGRLSIPTDAPLPMLDVLHADPTRYVTRSVANHLNDLSKSNPAVVIDRLQKWKSVGQQKDAELQWISRHALRTLVKKGDAAALRFLGFRTNPKITVSDLRLRSARIKPGEAIDFSFHISADRKESLVVDFVIDFVKANGTLAPKVHKLKQLTIGRGESVEVQKRHPLRANATTYTLYPGTHRLTVQINGKAYATETFDLV